MGWELKILPPFARKTVVDLGAFKSREVHTVLQEMYTVCRILCQTLGVGVGFE